MQKLHKSDPLRVSATFVRASQSTSTPTMPPQHVEIAETIAALKRALRREREGNLSPISQASRSLQDLLLTQLSRPAPTDQVISAATNRGHKLSRGANYVHAGALPYPHGPEGHKQVRSVNRIWWGPESQELIARTEN